MTALLIPLCIFALALAPTPSVQDHARAFEVCEATDSVVHDNDRMPFGGPLARLRTGMQMIAIARHESGFKVDAYNAEGGDTGLMQVRPGEAWGAFSRVEILRSAYLGMWTGYRAMIIAHDACPGTAVHWLGAYASGHCGWAQSTARALCSPAMLCDVR